MLCDIWPSVAWISVLLLANNDWSVIIEMHHICSGETQKTNESQYSYDDGYTEGYWPCKTFARERPEKSFRGRKLYN